MILPQWNDGQAMFAKFAGVFGTEYFRVSWWFYESELILQLHRKKSMANAFIGLMLSCRKLNTIE
jgi:hypothetical protein